MSNELTKSEKKHARFVMDKGLDYEYKKGLKFASDTLEKWQAHQLSTREAYLKLIQGLQKIDNQISEIHDGRGGSWRVHIMAIQLSLGYISIEDIKPFREETKHRILYLSGENDQND